MAGKILVFMNKATYEIVRCGRWDAVPLPNVNQVIYEASRVTGVTRYVVDRVALHTDGPIPEHVEAELQQRAVTHFGSAGGGYIVICWMTATPMTKS